MMYLVDVFVIVNAVTKVVGAPVIGIVVPSIVSTVLPVNTALILTG